MNGLQQIEVFQAFHHGSSPRFDKDEVKFMTQTFAGDLAQKVMRL